MPRPLLLPPALVALAACTQAPPSTPREHAAAAAAASVDEPGPCSAAGAAMALGQPFDQALGERARTGAGAELLRVIRPGDAVTMDFRPERLNLELDSEGRVAEARCG